METLSPQSLHSQKAHLAPNAYVFLLSPALRRPSPARQGKHKSSSQEGPSQEDPRTLTEKAFDPDFTPSKLLSSNAPLTASAQAISKWIAKLRLSEELKAHLQQSCKVAAATLKSCTEEEIHILHQRAADFGFPVRHLKDAKDDEILKIVLAACAMTS